ncbi:PIN domain-containing protein [Pseudalkalibacillus decolorationis]|uniref:PIN domain-containing protein n=1 Tax=Pseudalkalibacillus decolorationis TaxID=163879 RepID=UPI00214968B2|nr:PIN domain-containing protein [Pseudalkalibacillus decolorationis]
MNKVIYDTNFYNDLSIQYPEVVEAFISNAKQNATVIMPSILEHELLSYSRYEEKEVTKAQIDDYISLAKNNIIPLTREIAQEAARIRRYLRINHQKRLKAPDSIIAATAIVENATLFSNNDLDFKLIQNELQLSYENPVLDQLDLQKFREKLKEGK